MSQQNVEIVRELLTGFAKRDHERAFDLYDRDIEWDASAAGTARGKASGVEVGQPRGAGVGLFHVRGGKVTRLVFYFDNERAFADLGIEE